MTADLHRGGWTSAHGRYVLLETAIALVITTVLSAAFAWLFFAGSVPISATAPALQIDGALQALVVAFMSALVPGLIARRRLGAGSIVAAGTSHAWPRSLPARSFLIAAAIAIPATLLHLIVTATCLPAHLDLKQLLTWKVGFGVAIALIATPWAVALSIRD